LARTDVEIAKIGEKLKVGFIELDVELPEKLELNYFITPYCIIDQTFAVPPCHRLNIGNKGAPIALLPVYEIRMEEIEFRIHNWDILMGCLQRCNPYFTEYHHDNISMEVVEVGAWIGFHNSWMIMSEVPRGS
jgi:hypothetical protein